MSDFLTRTAQLALGIGRRVEPLIAPRFAPAESLAMPRDDTSAVTAARATATEEAQPQMQPQAEVEEHEEVRPPVPRAPVIKTEPEAPAIHEQDDAIAPIAPPREDRVEVSPERTRRPLPSPQPRARGQTPALPEQQEQAPRVERIPPEQVEGSGRLVRSVGTLVRHPERVEGPGWEGGAETDNELATPPPRSLDTLGMTAITAALSPSSTTTPTTPPTSSAPTTRTTREQPLEPASAPEPPPPLAPREQQQTPREREREREQRPLTAPTEPFLRDAPRSSAIGSRRESASAPNNDEPPPVIVEIGRIEIINPAPPPPPAAPAPALAPMSLDGYLSRRKGRA